MFLANQPGICLSSAAELTATLLRLPLQCGASRPVRDAGTSPLGRSAKSALKKDRQTYTCKKALGLAEGDVLMEKRDHEPEGEKDYGDAGGETTRRSKFPHKMTGDASLPPFAIGSNP